MTLRLRIAAWVAPLLVVASAPPAHGAEVNANRESDFDTAGVSIVDQRGARNDLTVTAGPRRLVVRERGRDKLRVSGACRRRAARVAVCPSFGSDVEVLLGRGDDRLAYRSATGEEILSIDAGRGDDTVTVSGTGAAVLGAEGHDVLQGGSGPDSLYGGPGRDLLRGGAADDVLQGDGRTVDADALDGGSGRDLASWAGRRRPVRVDLATGGRGGVAGEGDRLASIEGAVGGERRDRLLGDEHDNVLHGGRGADLLVGRGGDDLLDAGSHHPGYGGGPDGARDRIRCGPGRDSVSDPALDPLARDCERITESEFSDLGLMPLDVLRPAGRRRVRVEVFAPVDAAAARTERRVILYHGGRVLGRSRRVRVRTERRTIAVRLRRPLPRRGLIRVVFDMFDEVDGDVTDPDYEESSTDLRRSRFAYRIRR